MLAQTFAIIFIVIIAIVLTLYFAFEVYNIPNPVNTPFTDGTMVRIRSLANNKYLQVISCTGSFANCNNPYFRAACRDLNAGFNVLGAIGDTADDASIFTIAQLKQNPRVGSIPRGPISDNAAYMLYLGKNTGDSSIRFQTLDNVRGVVVANNNFFDGSRTQEGNSYFWKNFPSKCFCGVSTDSECQIGGFAPANRGFVLEFELVENASASNPNKIPTGSYFIKNFCNTNDYMFNPATASGENCPPIITKAPRPPTPTEPKLTQYCFSIEIV